MVTYYSDECHVYYNIIVNYSIKIFYTQMVVTCKLKITVIDIKLILVV